MDRKLDLKSKVLGVAAILIVLSNPAVAENQTVEFEAFSGTVDSNGNLVKTDTNIDGYNAVVYNFDSNSFTNATGFYTEKETSDSNMTLNFNITEEEENYGIYFFKRDSNGEDSYITYEYTIELNQSGNNQDEIDSTQYNDKIYFTRKTGAESTIEIDQFDELAAGDPVTVGVDIRVDAPIDETYVTDYVPNNEFGQENLTEFYRTDVQYDLEAVNLTSGSGSTVDSKSDIVSLEFGGSKYLNFTTIDKTGYYNITGETDPTVDSKVSSGTKDSDSEQIQYLSKIKTVLSRVSSEYTVGPAEAQINLKDNLPATEADIAEEIEFAWLNRLNVGQSKINSVQGSQGLDAVNVSKRKNYTVVDSGYLPYSEAQSSNGDWYLCHRAWVSDTRSFISKGETSCSHFMVDNQRPSFSNIQAPSGIVEYSEDGFDFNISVSDNIQLEEVNFTVDNSKKVFNSFNNPSGNNEISYTKKLDARPSNYTYTWRAWDKVMIEQNPVAQGEKKEISNLQVNPLSTKANISIINATGSKVTKVGLMEDITVEVTSGTENSPLDIESNTSLISWSNTTAKGNYTKDLTMRKSGIFKFNVTAGKNNGNYGVSSDSVTLNVSSSNGGNYDLGFNESLSDQSVMESESFNYTANVSYNGTVSNLTWNINRNGLNRNSKLFQVGPNGSKSASITNQTSLSTGEYEVPVEVYDNKGSYITDTFNVTVNPDLYWSNEPSDQSIDEGNRFSIDLKNDVNYVDNKYNLTWNITKNRNLFKANDGLVEDKKELSVGSYDIELDVSDNSSRSINTSFTLTVNSVSSGGGGGGSSSGGGGGSLGSLSTQTETESIDDRIQTSESEDYNFNITSTETGRRNITINLSEPTEINTSITGNLSEIASIERFFNGTKGINQIPFNITSNRTGRFEGNISLEWNNQTKNIPVTLTREELKTDYTVLILTNNDEIYSDRINYDVKVRDRANPVTRSSVQISTKLLDENGTQLYRNTESADVTDVAVRNFETGILEPGRYRIDAKITDSGKTFTGYKTVELRETEGVTGRFSQATSGLQGAIDYIVQQINSLF